MKHVNPFYTAALVSLFMASNAFSHSGEVHPPVGEEYLEDTAYKNVRKYARELKMTLRSAIAEGGFLHGVAACRNHVPGVIQSFEEDGWDVSRTSLKVRNPENAPDAWEKQVLQEFEQDRKNGAPFKQLVHSEIVEENGERVYRFMQAIPAKSMCLTCHGANIGPSLAATIKWKYPKDKAVNFRVDDIRGAFTLSKKL